MPVPKIKAVSPPDFTAVRARIRKAALPKTKVEKKKKKTKFDEWFDRVIIGKG